MAAENQLVEEWLRAARRADYSPDTAAQVAATIALAEGVKWIGELLTEHNVQLTELVRLAREGREAWDASVEAGG